MVKYAIFGCGKKGKQILEEIGKKAVSFFVDNDVSKQGCEWKGVPICDLTTYVKKKNNISLLVPITKYYLEMKKQLLDNGIEKWIIYQVKSEEGNYGKLILNPYEGIDTISYAENQSLANRELIKDYAKQLNENVPLFEGIEIETYNRCNGGCSFCPVSVKNESRPEKRMSEKLFHKIIKDLEDLNYEGKVCLFSNNEPFLDDRIIDFQIYARRKLPKAHLYMYTNGTLLTEEKFLNIIPYLDELIIDNYNQNLQLIPSVKKIVGLCEENAELKKKVSIVLRKPQEVLTSRGGDSPNKKMDKNGKYLEDSCILLFKQLIVRPDGKISLCCNDPLGRYSLGDLNVQSIEEVWYGDKYREMRDRIVGGRRNIDKCIGCDTFLI